MTTLDQRLYAWLLESDERRFELAFKAYFEVAFPSVLRHLARLSRWDPAHLEELTQDALLRFFDKVGRRRREASESVSVSLSQIRPLNFGVFHERQVTNWTRDVGLFRESAMGFRPPQADDTQWRTAIRVLADRIPALQGQGRHLLHSVHLALNWTFDDPVPAAAGEIADPNPDQWDDVQGIVTCEICEELVEEMRTNSARTAAAERDHPGAGPFVQGTSLIVRALPHLRVPTNGYLFEIAGTIYLDECKKRGRRKRGGEVATAAAECTDDASSHPIERLAEETFAADDGEERFDEANPARTADGITGSNAASVDPASQIESEDLFEKFYEYLRRPLDDAVEAFHIAQSGGRAAAERRKVDSLTEKFSRTMSVLSVMGEGYTQEQTAERLGLSRNQIKYIIELVQDSYAQFTAQAARHATQAAVSGVSHAI
jgi:DNA-directed RNA polymerase specialized sigma24 family protein